MSKNLTDTVEAFDNDVHEKGGYRYTTGASLSSVLANRRITEATFHAANMSGARVLDIGCGDGTYTIELFERCHPNSICGIDPAVRAIESAITKAGSRPIEFQNADAIELPFGDDSFDIAHLRGVLHHMARPEAAIKEAFRVAPRLVIIEPNGISPILKILERFSEYHREHDERSFTSWQLSRWIEEAGGEAVSCRWVGLVPFFCPDWAARLLKKLELIVESVPLVRSLCCAVAVITAQRVGSTRIALE